MQDVKKSYLKWAGGKSKIAQRILDYVPMESFRLVEPFVGSAAFALNAAPRATSFLLADVNPDLVALHNRVLTDPDALVEELRLLFRPENNTKERYIALREAFNATSDQSKRAALFLYLNKHGFNGLCRYNASGGFNVPFGDMKSPKVPVKEILAFSSLLQSAKIIQADFRSVVDHAGTGDLLYCDPPYAPLSETASFASYATGGFSAEDQRDLAQKCEEATVRGAFVMISNHDTPFTREIYAGAREIVAFDVSRSVSAAGGSRGKAKELIAIYGTENAQDPHEERVEAQD